MIRNIIRQHLESNVRENPNIRIQYNQKLIHGKIIEGVKHKNLNLNK